MIDIPLILKFAIAIIWDILDFTIFRIPAFGTLADAISIPIAVALWGPMGIAASWELVDLTDQVDAFIPTITIIGLMSTFTQETETLKQITTRPKHA